MIGDGSKIMMCDFFYGRVYTDLLINPGSLFDQSQRDSMLKMNPEFAQFGEKFTADNQQWLKRREAMGQHFNA
tara:strand:- start:181 stop:399 length:219 start_codon:yes stop_codon:yes gene_type:complete